jgi:DNA-binding transcriptional LysR family regulator
MAITAACSPVHNVTPIPTPQVVEVAYPPSLRLVEEALNSCDLADEEISLQVFEIPGEALKDSNADLILWSGEPPGSAGYSAPLALERIVFIVHPQNPARSLTLEQINALYQGEIENWEVMVEMDEPVTVWAYPPGNEVQQGVIEELIPFDTKTFSRFLAPDPLAMIQAVSSQIGGIGFVPEAWVTDGVDIVEIEGEEGVEFQRPVLVISKNTPAGAVRRFLSCLQSPAGQEVLGHRYQPWID